MVERPAVSVTLLLASIGLHACCQSPADFSVHVVEILNCSRLVHYVHPIYPKDGKRRHVQGTVKLRAVIGENGELRNIEVLEGDPELVPAAKQAIRKWRYTLCLLNGKALEPITMIDVPFTLSQ